MLQSYSLVSCWLFFVLITADELNNYFSITDSDRIVINIYFSLLVNLDLRVVL